MSDWTRTENQERRFEQRWLVSRAGELWPVGGGRHPTHPIAEVDAVVFLHSSESPRVEVRVHTERYGDERPPRTAAVFPGKTRPKTEHLLRFAEHCAFHLAKAWALMHAIGVGEELEAAAKGRLEDAPIRSDPSDPDGPLVAELRAGAWREAHDYLSDTATLESAAAAPMLEVADYIEKTGLGWEEYLAQRDHE